MARRRRDDDLIWPVAQLVGLFVALGFAYPPFRQVVVGVGSLFVLIVVLAVAIVFGIGIYKLAVRRRAPQQRFAFEAPAPRAPLLPRISPISSPQAPQKPQTAEQLINQLRSIDWFQFEQLVALLYRKQGYCVHALRHQGQLRTVVRCWRGQNEHEKRMRTRNDESPAARLARAEEEDRLDAAWLEQCPALTKAAQERGLAWFHAVPAVQGSLPPRPAGFEQRKQFCNRCGEQIEMNWDFDALFCRTCNRWVESTCSQRDCGFCRSRPARPLP